MKVSLISYTDDPLKAICMAAAIMKEKDPLVYVNNQTQHEREDTIMEILKTRLRGALEFASFEFLIEGVSRAFTHQLVRHRSFHFSQQSLRFYNATESEILNPCKGQRFSDDFDSIYSIIRESYSTLLEQGCPIEKARAILPTNVCTNIAFGATYRGLVELAEVRMCLQTQDEFREIMKEIVYHVYKVEPILGENLISTCDRTGHCEFQSIFDRPCTKRTSREKEEKQKCQLKN